MPGNKYVNINSATTTTIKSRSGILKNIIINTTAAGAITVYANTAASGSIIAIFPSSAVVGTYTYDARFSIGLTIVTAAASNITVTYE